MSKAQTDFLGSGLTVEQVARRFSNRGKLTPNQLKNAVAYVRRIARHGTDSPVSAERLAQICKCDSGLFLYGTSGATGTQSKSIASPATTEAAAVCGHQIELNFRRRHYLLREVE